MSSVVRKECHLPFWVPGSGHYGEVFGESGRHIVTDSASFLLSWIDSVPVKKGSVFTVAELGTNDGYATLPLFVSLIDQLRKRHGENWPVMIIYEDQEKNDFNSLFNRLTDSSPITTFSNVFPLVTNINFYSQVVPDGTCDVILTSLSSQWLENPQINFKDCVFHPSATQEELTLFRAEAEKDWEKFLVLRARELKSGGLLLALIPTTMDGVTNGRKGAAITNGEAGHQADDEDWGNMVDHHVDVTKDMEAAWKELRDDNIITQKEYEQCTNGELFRTPREITLPFESATSPVRQAGLSVEYLDQVLHRCAYKLMWRAKLARDGVDDRNYFAESMVNAHRVWSQCTFSSSLSESRSKEEKDAIMDQLYKRHKEQVLKKDPATYRSDLVISRLVVRKL